MEEGGCLSVKQNKSVKSKSVKFSENIQLNIQANPLININKHKILNYNMYGAFIFL